jgi:peptidoglycan biosynthesis protein MviN/MurJ (putative lipid II flippase)
MQVWGHWGIALMISLVSCLNTGVLYVIFRRRLGPLNESLLARQFGTHFLLALALGVCLFVLSQSLAAAPGSLMTLGRLAHFAGVMAVGGGLYLVLGLVFKVEEVKTLVRLVRRRFGV